VTKSSTVAPNQLIAIGLLVTLLSIGVVTLEGARESSSARALQQHNSETMTAIHDIAIDIRNAETGQRGYLLTGNADYLDVYTSGSLGVGASLAALIPLIVGNMPQQEQLQSLRPLLAAKFSELAESVRIRRQQGLEAAALFVETNRGRNLMLAIEADLTKMTQTERAILADRLTDTEVTARLMSAYALAATFGAMVALFWGARKLNIAASTDSLTGLLNRTKIWEIFNFGLQRGRTGVSALIYVNLDRFRSVNQMFGSDAGDAVLIEVGHRLRGLADIHALGRRGGDDFVFCCGVISVQEAENLARSAVDLLARPFDFEGHRLHLTASVGIAHIDTAGDVDLRQGADDAIWVAKSQGGNRPVVFARSMLSDRKNLAEMEEALRHAIASETEISLAYQPVVSIAGDRVVAVEVLARWAHPRFGEIAPGRFIPLAEARGLIVSLGGKVMRMAIAQAKIWRTIRPHDAFFTNINFSPIQFETGDVIAEFAALLSAEGLKTSDFCIEVTEGAFTDAHAIRGLEEARRIGFRVTMDDFGVGYSCLAQLPRLPLVSVKLDRSFILNATENAGEAVMLGSIVQLAHAQNLLVIAEGIETEAQLRLTAAAGCDSIQGYYCARPMSAIAFEQWLANRDPKPSVMIDVCGG
jgi:diguanylate cyclase (GGDEF)-like protein